MKPNPPEAEVVVGNPTPEAIAEAVTSWEMLDDGCQCETCKVARTLLAAYQSAVQDRAAAERERDELQAVLRHERDYSDHLLREQLNKDQGE